MYNATIFCVNLTFSDFASAYTALKIKDRLLLF